VWIRNNVENKASYCYRSQTKTVINGQQGGARANTNSLATPRGFYRDIQGKLGLANRTNQEKKKDYEITLNKHYGAP